ncbi:MAG: DUF11 domain-containing protein, partial [Candidatus Desantisbacteria bacterium]
LIAEYNQVIEVDCLTQMPKKTWQAYNLGLNSIREATLIEGNKILVAGSYYGLGPEGKVVEAEFKENGTLTGWSYSTSTSSEFSDVEAKGVLNYAKVLYSDGGSQVQLVSLASVIVPIYQPLLPPNIVATKTAEISGDINGQAQPGATITYTICFQNNGEVIAKDVAIIDRIPEGTVYVPGSAQIVSPTGTIYYSAEATGDAWQTPTETSPVTRSKWVIDGDMDPGDSGSVTFAVQVK